MDLNTLRRMAGVSEVFAGDKAQYTKKPQINEADVSLSTDINELTDKSNRKFILVHDALSEESVAQDMIAVLDGPSFALAFIGAHSGTNDAKVAARENWTLYHFNQMNRALVDVNTRLKRAGIDSVVTESMLVAEDCGMAHEDEESSAESNLANDITNYIEKHYSDAMSKYGAEYMASIILNVANRYAKMKRGTASDVGTLADIVIGTARKEQKTNEENEEEIDPNGRGVDCPICGDTMPKEDFYGHMMSKHKAVMRGPYDDAAEDEEISYEDEEAMNYKSSLNKGQHVEYNGQPHIVVVPDAQGDFVGIAPVGQEDDPDAVNLVHAREIMKGEEEEMVMDVRIEGVELSTKAKELFADKKYIKQLAEDSEKSVDWFETDAGKKHLNNIAKTHLKEAEDATVWDNAMDDKDESPENPKKDDVKVTVPPKVKSALKKESKELRAAAEKVKVSDSARAEFYNNCAAAMEKLLGCLEYGTMDGVKKAQIHMTSLMSPIVSRIPDVAHDFITGGGEPTTLKNLFAKVKEKK
jgi:hypothetical protein